MKKLIHKNQPKFLIFSLVGVSLLLILSGVLLSSYALTEPVKSISFTSKSLNYGEKEPGSFEVTKKAEWTSYNTAKITFNVDTVSKVNSKHRDIILVLDLSDSMAGDRMLYMKSAAYSLVNKVLEDSENRVAVIGFGTEAEIVSEFSNNASLITRDILSAEIGGKRNHYDAFVKVDKLLWSYQAEEDRECMVVFVTDGYADKGSPNQYFEYQYLKSQYPFLSIKGIQFDAADKLLPFIQKISDAQYMANLTDIESVLIRATELPVSYDSFELNDWINFDYFSVASVSSMKASTGEVKLVEEEGIQKVTWNLGSFKTGENHELTINLDLKPEFHDGEGIYPTNIKEEVSYKLESVEETVSSNDTPALSSHYQVIYDANAPTDCSVGYRPETTKHRPLEPVKISDENISCSGYQFTGWKIVSTGLEHNDGYFEMPEHDVILEAEWTKLSIVKSMDGNLNPKLTGELKATNHSSSEYKEYNDEIWKYKKDTTKVVFEDYIHSHHSEVEVFDISREKNDSVIGRVVSNEDGETYTIYIQADGNIISGDESCIGLFANFSKLEAIEGLEFFDTRKAYDMSQMFDGCSSLKELDLSHFKTAVDHAENENYYKAVIHMDCMFRNCSSLKTLDLRSFDTLRLATASLMFFGCTSLESIDLSSFNIRDLADVRSMFQECTSLKELDLSNFKKTYPQLNGSKMFFNCHSLEKINLGKLNPYGDVSYMFAGCYKLKELDLSGFDFTFTFDNMTMMFSECYALTSLDLSNFNTSYASTMRGMFSYCSSLVDLKINPDTFTTAKVSDMGLMFLGCENLTGIDVSKFDTSKVIDMNQMFAMCSSLPVIDVSNFNTALVRDMSLMFDHCSSVTTLDVSKFDTSQVVSMANMFSFCSALTNLDVSGFDTANVTDMSVMFRQCRNVPVIDVSHFDTSKVVDMNNMFDGCSSITALDVSGFDTSNVRGMAAMFASCGQVPYLDVSHFDTSKVENMTYMFAYCFALNNLDTSSFNTAKVTDMSFMFDSCYVLVSIDFSNADTSKVVDMQSMFNECYQLQTISGIINTNSVRNLNNMFLYCYNLLNATININCGTDVGYYQMFFEAAYEVTENVKVNYTSETADLVDLMIATKTPEYSYITKGELIA